MISKVPGYLTLALLEFVNSDNQLYHMHSEYDVNAKNKKGN